MPLPAVHFLLAREPLRRWAIRPGTAPFDPRDPIARNAYFQGALGPDMGLFPGGEPALSELAHTHRAGDLARSLFDSASTDLERAFAAGWLTHVLADSLLHPVVNACAAAVEATPHDAPAPTPALLSIAHARIELGLDVHISARHRDLAALRLRPCFGPGSIRYLADAFRATYGVSFPRDRLLRSHRGVGRLSRALAILVHIHSAAGPGGRARRVVRRVLRALRPALTSRISPTSAAFLSPLRPPRRLLRALRDLEAGFADLVLHHEQSNLSGLGNPDLDGREPAWAELRSA